MENKISEKTPCFVGGLRIKISKIILAIFWLCYGRSIINLSISLSSRYSRILDSMFGRLIGGKLRVCPKNYARMIFMGKTF